MSISVFMTTVTGTNVISNPAWMFWSKCSYGSGRVS